ncbi:hypothetical protein [Methylobacterium brachiatum]|jgi:uncharacterized protein YjbJ (UPF0337 family)|nr:hypothetical protein [Methylobacterium brachiatum]MDH2313287.1 hypothetical protein [Methylobacterium brachiatum]
MFNSDEAASTMNESDDAGETEEAKGSVTEAIGKITADPVVEAAGAAKKRRGRARAARAGGADRPGARPPRARRDEG